MKSIIGQLLATVALLAGMESAYAVTTYKWVITDNFQLSGNPVIQYEPSTCSQMTSCPNPSPSTFYYGNSTTATATASGASPTGDVYIGYKWANGVDGNECDFYMSGTVNADGTSSTPVLGAYVKKYTYNGYHQMQPGCTYGTPTSSCDANHANCTWTLPFSINTYNQ